MLAQSISQVTVKSALKAKRKIILPPSSLSALEIRIPEIPDTNNLYELGLDIFQLPKGMIPLRCPTPNRSENTKTFEDSSNKHQQHKLQFSQKFTNSHYNSSRKMQTSLRNQMVSPSKCQMISNFRSLTAPHHKRVTQKSSVITRNTR